MFKLIFILLAVPGAFTFWYRYPDLEYFHANANQRPNIIILGGPDSWAKGWTYISEDWRVLEFANTYALSLPNSGHSFSLSSYTLNNLAAVVAEFISRHDLSDVYLMGDFLGGRIAMQVAALYPDLIKGLLIQDAFPFAYSQDFVTAEKIVYQDIAKINLKRSLAAIRADLLNILKSPSWTNDTIDVIWGSEGDYVWPYNLVPFINNLQALSADIARRKFKGEVRFLLSEGTPLAPKSLLPQLKSYYPYIDVNKDVIYVNQDEWISRPNTDLAIATLRDLICH